MSSPGRTPLLNLSNKRRKSAQGSARSRCDKDKLLKEKPQKERAREAEVRTQSETELKVKAALKEACLENDVVGSGEQLRKRVTELEALLSAAQDEIEERDASILELHNAYQVAAGEQILKQRFEEQFAKPKRSVDDSKLRR